MMKLEAEYIYEISFWCRHKQPEPET